MKTEDLFKNISLGEKEVEIDTSEFEKDTTEVINDNIDNDETLEEDVVVTDIDTKGDPEEDGVDTSLFESIENNTSVDSPSSDESSSSLQLFASALLDEGLIDIEDTNKVKSTKDLIEGWRKKMLDNEFSDLDDNQKLFVQSLRNGIPEEEVKTNLKNIQALNNLNEEVIKSDENLGVMLVAQDFIAKGISEEKANKLATKSLETGTLADDALEAYTSLKNLEENRLKEENKKIEEERKLKAEKDKEYISQLKEKILNKEEFINGIKANSTTKEKVFKTMTEIVDYDPKGNPLNALNAARLKEPEKIAEIESYIFTITNGYKDFSTLKNKAKTKAIEELDKKLKTNNVGGGEPGKILSSTGKGLQSALENLKI